MESQVYSQSPFAEYLQDVNIDEPPVPFSGAPTHLSEARTRRRQRRGGSSRDRNLEQLKYSLASSALLAPTLADALELYPSLSSLLSQEARKRDKGKQRQQQDRDGRNLAPVTWPRNWETVGQTWKDRDNLANARIVLKGLIETGRRLTRGEKPSLAVEPIWDMVVARQASASATRDGVENEDPSDGAMLFEEVKVFVSEAQQLDRRIEGILSGFEEDQFVSEALSNERRPPSTPTQVGTPSSIAGPPDLKSELYTQLTTLLQLYQHATTQLASLLCPSSLPSATSPLPPDRASSPALSSLQSHGRTSRSHQPTASLSELHRHASRAIQERIEVEQWETAHSASGISGDGSTTLSDSASTLLSSPPTTSDISSASSKDLPVISPEGDRKGREMDDTLDPFHPTTTFFGGLERKSSTRSNHSVSSSTASFSHNHQRLRPSLGNVGAFGIGTLAGGGGASPLLREIGSRTSGVQGRENGKSDRRRRPVSMGGWIESSTSTPVIPLSPAALSATTSPLPTRGSGVMEGLEQNARQGETKGRNVQLRQIWENAHLFRKGFIWNLVAVFEEDEGEAEEGAKLRDPDDESRGDRWARTKHILDGLIDGLMRLNALAGKLQSVVTQLTERSERRNRIIARQSYLSNSVLRQQPDSYSPSPSSSSAAAPPSPSPSPHLRPKRSLFRSTPSYSSSQSASSPSYLPRHVQQPDFAPPPASSVLPPTILALRDYEASHLTLSQSLDTLRTSLNSIVSELRILSPTVPRPPSPPHATASGEPATTNSPLIERIEQVLAGHDKIRLELQDLANVWSQSRISLRQSLGVELKSQQPKKSIVSVQGHIEPSANSMMEGGGDASNDPRGDAFLRAAPGEEEEDDLAGSPLALLDDGRAPLDDADLSSRQAVLDAALSSYLGPGIGLGLETGEVNANEEKVFEAVVGERKKKVTKDGEPRVSREERVKRMKEAREALDIGKRAAGSSGENTGAGHVADFEAQQRMVGELRQVLKGLGKGKDN